MIDSVLYDAPGFQRLASATGWAAAIAALVVLALVVACLSGWRERRVTPQGWVALFGLRVVAILAAALLLAGLERRPMSESVNPSRVVLLVDRSASMQLPATEDPTDTATRLESVEPVVEQLATRLEMDHMVRPAAFDVAVSYDQPATEAGGVTRLGAALRRVLEDHASAPLAGVVLVSDGGWNAGAAPDEATSVATKRGTPIHAVGVGPKRRRPNVGIRDLAAPTRASVGDPFRATVTLNVAGAPPTSQRVLVELRPMEQPDRAGEPVMQSELVIEPAADGSLTGAVEELRATDPGRYEVVATLETDEIDADPGDNQLSSFVELVDEPTRVLLVAGGPTRDYHFLRDQLHRDDEFTCDVVLQTAAGAATQDAGQVLAGLPQDRQAWEAYDALIAIDYDWRVVADAATEALAEWVASRGGGLVFIAAGVQTPACVRSGLATPLKRLLPVTLRDDPLALSASLGAAVDPMPVRPTPAAASAQFLHPPRSTANRPEGWEEFPGFYLRPVPAEVKPGATALARLGEAPLLVEHAYGAGRVVYLASAETWRLRRVNLGWFTSLHTGLLRRVSQGRLLGAAAEGSLLFDRQHYDLGEAVSLRFVARSAEGAASVETLPARLVVGEGAPREVRLAAMPDQTGVFAATLRADELGRHTATLLTPGGKRLTAAASVSLPSLENETIVQDVELLQRIATATGGVYVDLAANESIDALIEATPSLAETTIELGPPDEQFARGVATGSLAVMAGALLIEWLLRRSWRLA